MYICSRYHDVLMMYINLNNIAILNINSVNYRFFINEISRSDALNLPKNADLNKKNIKIKKL